MISSVNPYHIVIADDHEMFREDLKKILLEKPHWEVVGEANDGLALLDLLDRLVKSEVHPELVITDISMPNLSGIEATRRIKKEHPELRVLIVSMHTEREYVYHAMAAGAQGYLAKADLGNRLFSAIERIRHGGIYIYPLLV
ncbi:MAG: response regulator transcription factor [Thermodesulfobacteriota bacterium]